VTGPVSGDGPRFQPKGLIVPALALVGGLWLGYRALSDREPGEPLNPGTTFWAVLLVWLCLFILTGAIRGLRHARLVSQAEASGGTLMDPPSPFLWIGVTVGALWRLVLFVTPGLALLSYGLSGSTSWTDGECSSSGSSCITGAVLWVPVAGLLILGGLVLAFFSVRHSLRDARRRLDGLPPEERVAIEPALDPEKTGATVTTVTTPGAGASDPSGEGIDRRIERLTELAQLHKQGIIDDGELARLKAEALDDSADVDPAG
jgi:hypothetical protein